jgi:thioesterase domain-containing protein/aryl carrier-like protein
MDELKKRIANLSPAKRAFLDQRVNGLAKNTVISRNLGRDLAPVAFRSDGAGTPLFLFHYLTPSQTLAKHLGPDRPVFGIASAFEEELYLWAESGRIAVSLEELARRCLAELQTAQPRGPYCLAGFCFGGALAFEVAKQLKKQGEPVAFLGLLDSFYLPGVNPMSLPPWVFAEEAIAGPGMQDANLRQQVGGQLPWLTNDEIVELFDVWEGVLPEAHANERPSGMTEAEKEFSRRVLFMREVVKPYRSEPYPGSAVLFRAMVNRDPSLGANGWDDVILGGLQLEDCQITRMGLFEEPFVGELAARLAEHLARVDEHHCGGEVDRKVISVPDHARRESNNAFVEPRAPVERALADIWSQVLRVEQVGVYDRFFELGGDSVLAMQVIARAKKAGLRLTVKQIFQHPTIAELALVAEPGTHPDSEQGLITGENTPSDFSEAGLDQQELDSLIAELGEE